MYRHLPQTILLCASLSACVSVTSPTVSQTEKQYAAARDEVWAREKAIYEARSNGDLSYYVANASANYKGWPPYSAEPGGMPYLKDMATSMVGQDQEELTMELADFALSGDTAVIYYHTHRTRMPNGDPADQRYAICHVWTREDGAWKLVGAMGREKAGNDE